MNTNMRMTPEEMKHLSSRLRLTRSAARKAGKQLSDSEILRVINEALDVGDAVDARLPEIIASRRS